MNVKGVEIKEKKGVDALFKGEDQSQWSNARGEEEQVTVQEKGIDKVLQIIENQGKK